ncbi:MAG: Ig-like domain-containing protein [Deltaproteobacteria bacterium]|nr:Ig-like domain-containing protein [Deltaproteobacteria bacterium]
MCARTRSLLLVVMLLSCGTTQRTPPPGGPAVARRPGAAAPPQAEFVYDLSEGLEDAAAAPRLAAPPATPLAPAAVARLLARLGPPPKETALAKDFALRERSPPPPRPGQTIKETFPPPGPPAGAPPAPGGAPAEPLTVLRHSPDGEVPLAPNLSVTFSQPMVAVTSHAEAVATVPVRLTPTPPGTWRWIGTRTLLFQPEERFPMATEYRIEVPAGTRASGGGTLARDASFTFATPPLTIVRSYPAGGSARLDPTIFLELDQKIDPAKLLGHVRLLAGGSAPRVQLLDDATAKADRDVGALVKAARPGRWLAFRPTAPLPPATRVTVSVERGAPSAEGPRTTSAPLEVRFETYGPLRIKEHRCGWGRRCPPYSSWSVVMTNPIDPEAFDPQMVTVTPTLPGQKVEVYGANLSISGRSRGRTRYTVTLAPTLPDVHGQTLGRAESVSFSVDEAAPLLTAPRTGFAVLDPAGGPRFSVFTINHDSLAVRLYAVRPEQWFGYQEYLRDYKRHDTGREPPGQKVFDGKVAVRSQPDELTETRIDLSPALRQGLGHVVAIVETPAPLIPIGRPRRQRLETWVQSTRLGLDVFVDQDRLLAWASALADGAPVAGAQVEILPAGTRGQTGADGLASVPLEDKEGKLLVARRGDDSAILPESTSHWGGGTAWMKRRPPHGLHLYAFDDRAMYKPGEEVRLKGWVRTIDPGLGGDVAAGPGGATFSYKVFDSRRNEVGHGDVRLGPLGGFDATFRLPKTMNLGQALVEITGDGAHFAHRFQVQEFRRPEFEVTAQGSTGPHLVGGHATATVRASYYADGPLPGADVTWHVTAAPGSFAPPNRHDFTFGTWTPWWSLRDFGMPHHADAASARSFTARTDPSGRHVLRIDLRTLTPPRPMSLQAEASVTDVNRQTWTAPTALLVHPAAHYVGLRTPRTFYPAGQAIPVDALVTDLDGKAIAGRPIAVRAERVDWVQERGTRREQLRDREDCTLQSTAEPGRCTFQPQEGGMWRITATIADAEGRPNQSQLTVWVPGGRSLPETEVKQERVELIPDRKEYQPGDVAEILALAPFFPAEALLTVRRSGLVATERAGTARFQVAAQTGAFADAADFKLPVWTPATAEAFATYGQIDEGAAILRHLGNRVSETAGAAHFTTSYGESSHLLLHSDRRADAIILEALIAVEPKADLIPKVVTGLLAHRTKGRWGNTQENTFVLVALDRYFNTYEKVTPDFVARAWLGDRFAGEHAFRGRSTERHHIDIPMAALGGGPPERSLIVQKQGPGRLYYRVGMQYAPTDLKPPPADHGFTVERAYQAVDQPAEVRRDSDGTWRIKAGARVRVRLTMVAPARRYHVALVDPLPAGLEALNPALAVTGTVPQSPDDTRGGSGRHGRWFWLWGPWYQHQNLRDERAEAFTPLLWDGVHTYSYVARATTPGTFVVPPPKAEEMYMPETFGRGAGDRVIVE